MNRVKTQQLIQLLIPYLPEHPNGIPPHLQVLGCLRFFGEGNYQKGCGRDLYNVMSQSSISKYLHIVCEAINNALGNLLHFPSTADERLMVSEG